MRFGLINPNVQFGAVFKYLKSYGAVRCIFGTSDIVPCGSLFLGMSYGSLRFGSPYNRFFYGAVTIPARKTVQDTFLSSVHSKNIYRTNP